MALYERFPAQREGELSRLRAQLVRQDALQVIAESIGVGLLLSLGEGELKSGGHRRPSILADATEAVFGAIYLDGGFDSAQKVIRGLYEKSLAALDPARSLKDPKTALQEHMQGLRMALPVYELVEVRGEAHAQEFEVACRVAVLATPVRGAGHSRRTAEQAAAAAGCALNQIVKSILFQGTSGRLYLFLTAGGHQVDAAKARVAARILAALWFILVIPWKVSLWLPAAGSLRARSGVS